MTAFKVTQVTEFESLLISNETKEDEIKLGGGEVDKKLPLKQNLEQALNKKIVVLPKKEGHFTNKLLT